MTFSPRPTYPSWFEARPTTRPIQLNILCVAERKGAGSGTNHVRFIVVAHVLATPPNLVLVGRSRHLQ